jgi:membrane peptidoglycan carboxypeptidase
VRFYPFVLGAEPVRPIDLAAFYAAIANEGSRVIPHAVEGIEQGSVVYRRDVSPPPVVSASDRAAFYQLKSMLRGVVKRGTARALAPLAPYMAGKTGTTEDENDAWFVGFTNEITVAVWVGYDNAGDMRRTLGEGATGAAVAAPIVESIIETAWHQGMSKTPLAPPSRQAQGQLSCSSVDADTDGSRRHASGECLRLDDKGRPIEARYRLVARDNTYARRSTANAGNRGEAGNRGTVPAQEPWRQGGGAAAFGAGQPSDWGRDWWGGWRRDDQRASPAPQRGFWNW